MNAPHAHHSHAGHNHAHGMAKQSLRLAFFLTIFILCAELTGAFLANSLALFSDAGHVVTDLFALAVAWFATLQAERPPNASKTFGYHRVGILAALINSVSLIAIALVILWEAIQRFQHPEPIQPIYMFISAGVGIFVNLYIGLALRKEEDNLNVRAATLHVFGDVAASMAVIVAGILVFFTGWTIVDPILSIGIASLVATGAWHILRETTEILLESTPRAISMTNLVRDMNSVKGVKDVHDLHVWSITSDMYALACHAIIDDLPTSNSSAILEELNGLLSDKYQIAHTTIQFECHEHQPTYCSVEGLFCRLGKVQDECNGHDEHSASAQYPPMKLRMSHSDH